MKVTSSWYLSGASMCTKRDRKEKEIDWGYLCNLPSNNPTDGGAHAPVRRGSFLATELLVLLTNSCETCRLMSIYCHKWHFLQEGCTSPLIADVRRQPVSMWLCTQQIYRRLWDEMPMFSELWPMVCGCWCSPVTIVWERGLMSSPMSLT